ncbi:hypothetical protein [Streptomyces viridochromogenes]|uniref:hypothetical protein n=1 Tax=Streptomyces viridochromogenes TaxID=1938 RepID=UPI00065C7F2C|nr:hypothetical protein [Streptomyces viridochromogenes]
MSAPNPKATEIVSVLAATLGVVPTEDASDERIRVEAEVPASLSEADRLHLLSFLLETADRFGHSLQRRTSRIWAEIDLQEQP